MMKQDDVTLLIDAMVQQTVVLIAQIATAGGRRAPLARVANQVFLGLVDELQTQGVTQTVTADMFGMALRTYQRKRRRLSESATEQGRSLWEAVLQLVDAKQVVNRAEILEVFQRDDEEMVRGILSDLVDSGLIYRTGRGHATTYRIADTGEIPEDPTGDSADAAANLLWVSIYRDGPLSLDDLCARNPSVARDSLRSWLDSLVRDGRVARDDAAAPPTFHCTLYVIPMDSDAGWAASVYDHYSAAVGTITNKLRGGGRAAARDTIGGSTFAFDVWAGHPFESEVLGLLAELRPRAQALRSRVDAYNESVGPPPDADRVVFYMGQNVMGDERDDE
jgi:hypothetical protein